MKIQMKITLSLLITSLVVICLLSAVFFYLTYNSMMTALGQKMLALASGQKSNVQHVASAWQDRVNLIGSRTKLRKLLAAQTGSPDQQDILVMKKILNDALSSVRAVQYIEMCDLTGRFLISSGKNPNASKNCHDFQKISREQTSIRQLWFDGENKKLLGIVSGPVTLEGRLIGVIYAVLDGNEILDITQNYDGLGKTGETILAERTEKGDAHFLTPLRYDANENLKRIVASHETNVPITHALQKKEIIMKSGGTIDYKGKQVLAATAYIPELDWGLVAKMDMDEALQPIMRLFYIFVQFLLIITIFVVLVGVYLGRRITLPILRLVRVTERVEKGDKEIRADAHHKDETGELARSFNSMLDTLNERTDELEEFAYRTSHDLRSPLVSAIGLLKATHKLIGKNDQEKACKSIDVALSSLTKLEELVHSILSLTRIKNEKEEPELIETDRIIREAVEKLSHMENFNRLDIQLDFHFNEPLSLKKSRLILIIENLISNAIKYQDTENEKSFIKISTYRKENSFIFAVEDNGLGIPDYHRENLFVMFQRFHTKTSFGSGLGLYMIKKSAEILGGDISYEDTGQGSRFILTTPIDAEHLLAA